MHVLSHAGIMTTPLVAIQRSPGGAPVYISDQRAIMRESRLALVMRQTNDHGLPADRIPPPLLTSY